MRWISLRSDRANGFQKSCSLKLTPSMTYEVTFMTLIECFVSFVHRKILTAFFAIARDMTELTKHRPTASDNFFICLRPPISYLTYKKRNLIENHNSARKRFRRDGTFCRYKMKSWKGHSHEEFYSAVLSDKFISELRPKKVKVSRLKCE